MIRAFLDANILVSAAIKPKGKADQVFRRRVTEFEWLSSEYVIAEVARVLTRRHIQTKYHEQVNVANRTEYVTLIREQAQVLGVGRTLAPTSRDSHDDPVLASAADGHADYIVTGDRDLLVLSEFEGIQIVTPEQFLQILDDAQEN